jgi:hypothetical protein
MTMNWMQNLTNRSRGIGRTLARAGGIGLVILLAGWVPAHAQQCTPQCPCHNYVFFAGEACLGPDSNGVLWYSLRFPNGNLFGFYNYANYPWMYHEDLGFEYYIDDGQGGAYFWDSASTHWFYTNRTSFPSLYDFTLNTWLWYQPDATNPNRYTSNPRYFYDFAIGQLIELGSTGNVMLIPQVPANSFNIDNTGSSTGTLLTGAPAVPFGFTYSEDPSLGGANAVAWGQVMLLDSALTGHCALAWGRPNSLTLYSGYDGTVSSNGGIQSDSFCAVSPPTITNLSDGVSVAVSIPFAFYTPTGGADSVLTQVYDDSGLYGPWMQVGSVTVTGELTTYTISGQVALAGVGLPGIVVSLSGNMSGSTTTDINGNYSFTGVPGGGSYTVTSSFLSYSFFPASIPVSGLSGSVSGVNFMVTGGSGTTAGAPPFNPPALPSPVVKPPAPVSATYQACGDITGTWSDPNLEDPGGGPATWSLSAEATITGTLTLISTGKFGNCSALDIQYDVAGAANVGGGIHLVATNPSVAGRNCEAPGYEPEPVVVTADVSAVTCPSVTPLQETLTWPPGGSLALDLAEAASFAAAPPPLWTRTSNPPGITLTSDIANANPSHQVTVAITDPGRTGDLTVTLSGIISMGQQGPVQPVTLGQMSNVGATPPGSPYTLSYTLASLPSPVSFSNVSATWNDLQVSVQPGFTTLGSYRFSQYNTIYENTCPLSQAGAFIFANNATCSYRVVNNLRGLFITQTTTNGTGMASDPTIGLLAAFRATALYSQCGWPEGSNQDPYSGNVFVMVPNVKGACNTQIIAGALATNPNPNNDPSGTWNCSDAVSFLQGNGSIGSPNPVQDFCPACSGDFRGANGHIDVYSSTQACSKVPDYPGSPLMGIRLR